MLALPDLPSIEVPLTCGQAVAHNDQRHHDDNDDDEKVDNAANGKVKSTHEVAAGQGARQAGYICGLASGNHDSLAAPRHHRSALHQNLDPSSLLQVACLHPEVKEITGSPSGK